jgi:retron-type reverse transcriptase
MHQVLNPLFDPDFSDNSYGFRPGRNAQQALLQAKSYQPLLETVGVDMDLAQFFDEVNHDILITRVARKVKDRRMITLLGAMRRGKLF